MKKKFLSLSFLAVSLVASVNAYSLPEFVVNMIAPKSFANCPYADPDTSSTFCASFKSVAECHCSASLPKSFCQDVSAIYHRMITVFGSQLKGCQYQVNKPGGVSVQDCMDDWNCYWNGGKDSQQRKCGKVDVVGDLGEKCEKLS